MTLYWQATKRDTCLLAVSLPWRIFRWYSLTVNLMLLHGVPKLGHIQVTLPNSSLCGQNNITVVLFHLTGVAAKEVSRIRRYDKHNFSPHIAIFLSYPITLRYIVTRNTWFWCLLYEINWALVGRVGGICAHEWITRASEKKKRTCFFLPGEIAGSIQPLLHLILNHSKWFH